MSRVNFWDIDPIIKEKIIDYSKTPTEMWSLISKTEEEIEELLNNIISIVEDKEILHIVINFNELNNIISNNNDKAWVLSDNLIYIYDNNMWIEYSEIDDITSIINDLDDLKNNKDIVTDFIGGYNEEDIILNLKINTDINKFNLDIDMSNIII